VFGKVARAILLLLPCWTGIAADSSFLLLAGPAPNGWQAESDVTTEASIVDDIIEMYEESTLSAKMNWYEQGHGIEGELTLMSLGANAGAYSAYDPLFNYYVDCFQELGRTVENEGQGVFDKLPVDQYAHAIVTDLFDATNDASSDGVETEAILATGLWMRVYHYLYQNLQLCTTNVDTRLMLRNIDKAAALWIGDKQTYGSNTVGVLLYNLVERTSLLFGQDEGEANVNTEFLSTLEAMKITVEAEECNAESGTNTRGYEKMHQYVTDAVRQMNILLVQRLIHFLETDLDTKFRELYVLSLLPQIRACSESEYEYFLNNVVLDKLYTDESLNIAHLQKMYSCLGVTCEDIGSYSGDRLPQCDGAKVEPKIPLASYVPVTDVHLHSKADRDIRQMKILLAHGNIDAAKDLYKKGRNMVTRDSISGYSNPNTLQHFASGMDTYTFSDDRSRLYIIFQEYYNGDSEYANTLVEEAFDSFEIKHTIPKLLQAIVAPHFAVRSFFEAVDVCENYGDRAKSVFDQGVAVLVGSNEGQNLGGSEDGESWFALAKEFCVEFQCDNPQNPDVNEKMLDLLNSSKEYIGVGNCAGLLYNVDRMESLIFIPIIQGLLYHTESWQLNPSSELHYASAQVFSKAILPLIKLVSKVQEHIIRETLSVPIGTTIDSYKVWAAIGNVLDDGTSRVNIGITCAEIGTPTFQDFESFCEFVGSIDTSPTKAPIRSIDQTDSPTNAVTMSPTRADREFSINRVLIKGRYSFTNITKAEQQALIALDLRDIIQIDRVQGSSEKAVNEARLIYSEGLNAKPLSLGELGNFKVMEREAVYNFYRQAWRDETIFLDYDNTGVNVVDSFADAVIRAAFDLASDLELAAESAITMTMWMQIIHLLSVEVESCRRGESRGGLLVDNAFAFYIGVQQTKGNSDGYLLYSLAQKAGIVKNTIEYNSSSEAKANIKIIPLFQQAKEYAKSCENYDVATYKLLRKTVRSIISTMNIPMVQFIEHYLLQIRDGITGGSRKPENYVELYTLAVLPQVLVCDPSAYDTLATYIIEGTFKPSEVAGEVDNILIVLENVYHCLGITCVDVHGNNANCPDEPTMLAGFLPEKNVNEIAKIDQDILKITALLNEDALGAAKEYYEYGDPVRDDPLYESLRVIALSDLTKMSPFHQDFKDYYGDNYSTDDFLMNIMSVSDDAIEIDDRSVVVTRLLQTSVLLPAGLGSMMSAVQACKKEESFDVVIRHWDTAAAFFIGSIEGEQRGGDYGQYGVGMYGLGKEVCWEFSSCSKGDVRTGGTNEKLIDNFSAGEQLISASSGNGIGGDCSTLEELVTEDIIPLLMVPLIQTILDAVSTVDRPSAFALTRYIIPIVNRLDTVSAATLDSEIKIYGGSMNATRVVNAFAGVIDGMGISCNDIGKWKKMDFDFCSFTNSNDDGTSLSNGLYVTTTDVVEWANIDIDVKDMAEAISNKNYPMAKDFYLNGFNSRIRDTDGKSIGIRSLGKMSLDINMIEEPVFNLYRYALEDDNGSFIADDVKFYAHSLVMSFFDDKFLDESNSSTLPVEAAVALNVWGNIVHKLSVTVERCDARSFQGDDNGVQYIDQAVAYWIGSAQSTGDSSKGHLLYRLSEEAGESFGQGLQGQARNNRKVLQLFTEAARLLSFSNGCNDNAPDRFRAIVNKIVAQMTVPLIQHLILNLERNDLDRIKLYGHAVVPLVAGCRESTYNNLKEKLITSEYSSDTLNEIIYELQSTYDCLGITCKDVGIFIGAGMPTCYKRQDLTAFAGYTPRTNAQEYSDIDLDIRYIDIMLRMKAYGAAKDVYTRGKHVIVENGSSVGPLSLHSLATAAGRKNCPSFQLFNTYFSDENYANSAIMRVFNEPIIPNEVGKSPEQKRAMIVDILRFMVTPMAALQKLYEAVDNCKIVSTTISKISIKRWDEAAALLIGSMEGSRNKGSEDGYLMYGLAGDLCLIFGVCAKKGNAQVNILMREALYAGSSSLSTQSCANVLESAVAIESHMLVPLIQASLVHAYTNSNLDVNSDNSRITSAYVYSRAVLPYIQDQIEVSAVIEKNFDFQPGMPPVEDGWQNVFLAFETAVDNMDNIDCRDVGYLATVATGICADDGVISGGRILRVSSSIVYLLVSTSLLAFNFLLR